MARRLRINSRGGLASFMRGGGHLFGVAPLPKPLRDLDGINCVLRPPGGLVCAHMQFAMVNAAQRHCELVADLSTEGARLCESNVVRIGRLSPTHEACL